MKKLIFILSITLFSITGCKKDNAAKSLQQEISGKWELVRSITGWVGTVEYAPGNGNFISFDGSNFTRNTLRDDTSYTTIGTFTIYKSKPCENSPETNLIEMHDFLSSSSYGELYEIVLANGELAIGNTQCIADGGTNFYRKID